MLTPDEIARIEANWNPAEWPAGAGYDYARAMHRRPFSYFRARVAHLGLSGGFLVDAGCGTGTWSFALACAFDRVLGIDFTLERVEVARWLKDRSAVAQPEFERGDIRALPLADGSADAVFCYSVALGAVPLDRIYREFYRVLRPGGIAYVELNGIGYGYNLFRSEGSNKQIGAGTVYNTYCQTALQPILSMIRPGGRRNSAALAAEANASPLDILRAADADAEALAAGEAIVNDLGDEYRNLLLNDLVAIARGTRDKFSQPSTGRGYTPQELEAISTSIGFRRYEWAHEGMLSLQSDGSVRKAKSSEAPPISVPEFEGRLRRFESLTWK